MRIVMVAPDVLPDPYGGIGTYLDGLLGTPASQNAQVHLVGVSRRRDLPRVSQYRAVTVRRVFAWPRAHASPPRSPLGMLVELARLNLAGAWYARRLHAREKVDLVAVHDWMCAPAGLVCAVLFRMPVCYHVHSAETFLEDGSRGMVAALGRLLNRALSRRARLVMTPTSGTVAAVPHLASRTDVAVVSHGAGKAWRMECPDHAERAAVRDKVRSLYAIPDGRRLVVFAGRYALHKGVIELIEAVRRMLDDGVDVAVVMAGTGWPDASLDQRLRERVERLGLGDRVQVLGRFLDTYELRDHLVAADACAFPSAYEPFGFVALEAMAMRARTVVGPGFDEAVIGSPEGACLRSATMDPAELAAVLVRAVGEDDPALGDQARRYVLDHHSWEAAATRTLQAYAKAACAPMTDKYAVTLGKTQETLLIPLRGRAVETHKKRGMLRDPLAVEMVAAIDYDFAKFDSRLSNLGAVLRTCIFDVWVRSFLADYPAGTVVEIGAGLNTRFERVDNGELHWVDLDLPDAMELRRRFFTDSDRRRMLPASVLDEEWVEVVKASPGPYFFAAEAVLMYLDEREVRRALALIAGHFPGARVALDTCHSWIIANQHHHDAMKKMSARMTWACDDPRQLERWDLDLRLLDSRDLAQLPRPLRRQAPFAYRSLLPPARLVLRKRFTTYKVNLYETGAG